MDKVQIELRREVFERLQALAEPLVDDASTVIERLLAHWDASARQGRAPAAGPASAAQAGAAPAAPAPSWRSANGVPFPVGARLRARYRRQVFEARVTAGGIEFGGRLYDNPSSAGIAAKESVGTTGKAAVTNGWRFWELEDAATGRWVSIDLLRAQG